MVDEMSEEGSPTSTTTTTTTTTATNDDNDNDNNNNNVVDGGGGAVVVVGVKLDGESRELLTWALVKVAQPGDHVIALHVLESPTPTFTEGTSQLLGLVKAFDSVLAVYEGFCNLKQVDLKLKVCRGKSAGKVLVRESKEFPSAKIMVGISKAHHTIRSRVSMAKFCARNLPRRFGVFAVDNGKILFQRDAIESKDEHMQDDGSVKNYVRVLHRSLSKKVVEKCNQRSENCNCCRAVKNNQERSLTNAAQLSGEALGDGIVDNSLALVPLQSKEVVVVNRGRGSHRLRSGWMFLRRMLLRPQQEEKPTGKKKSSSAVVYPDQKQNSSFRTEDNCELDGESGAIVPVDPEVSSPSSSYNGSRSIPEELEGLHERFSSTCRMFKYDELVAATANFIPENLVGRGGSSRVYKGRLPDDKEVAVKTLKPSKDVLKEFVSEIEIITTLNHKNIISLYGYCFEDSNLILVYDFLQRGSLEENLHGDKKDHSAFGWQERYKVAVGVAEALDYLHNGCAQPIIHRDVKSSNILLFDDFESQLSDFGLASRALDPSTQVTCDDVAGTFGYLAPEYFMHGKVSDKIDVYAFGVVILELLSGRKPIDGEHPKGQESLVMWAKPILKAGKVSQLLDPRLGSDYDHEQIGRMVLAATLCIRRSPRLRPQISLVLKLLQGDEEVLAWAQQQINGSEFDATDEEALPVNIRSHLNVALQDLEDETLSISSTEPSISMEDYLQGRWSRTCSFD